MTRVRDTLSFDEQILRCIEMWRDEHPGQPWDRDIVAEWIIQNGHWTQPKSSPRRELAKLISKAAKKKRVVNSQGKSVRVYHAAKFKFPIDGKMTQRTLWESRDSLTAEFANVSFKQRHHQVIGICRSLKNDIDDFNTNNPLAEGHEIQMEFDFTAIVETPLQPRVVEISPSEVATPESVVVNPDEVDPKEFEREDKQRRTREDKNPR